MNEIGTRATANTRRIGIAGHAGIGHFHGYVGFVQDDTAGFVTVYTLIKDILETDPRIQKVAAHVPANSITITTNEGGTFPACPKRGITPGKAMLIETPDSQDALHCQAVVLNALGRIYGQGVLETPVALQTALANAVMDSFHKKAPGQFKIGKESIAGNDGLIGGMFAFIDDVPVSFFGLPVFFARDRRRQNR